MNVIKHTFTVSDSLSFTVRTVLRDGDPWFIAKDVAEALGYSDCDQAIRLNCKRAESCPVPGTGQVRNMKIIPESDVYRLAMRSKLESAELFQDWVCEEVLPSIRKHGAYVTGMEELPELSKAEIAAQARREAHRRLLSIYRVCYTREHYNKAEWDKIGEAYAAAEAISRIRGDADWSPAFDKEFASQLTLHGMEFKKHHEKEAKARFNEAFRIELAHKAALKKHKAAYSSW